MRIYRAAKLSIYYNSERITQKMMIFNSFTVANDLFAIMARNDRTAVGFFFLTTNKTFKGICLALSGKFLERELWILFALKTVVQKSTKLYLLKLPK